MTSERISPDLKLEQRLAVLPLENLNRDPNDEYFADGMTDELITVLSRVPGLKVIARISVARYKETKKAISQIGRELKVGSLMEGTVMKLQDRVRISVQLIDARTEEHLWAKRYDRNLGDVFRIQSAIAAEVARELKVKLGRSAQAGLTGQTRDLKAHTLYLRARYQWSKRSEEGIRDATSLFEEAIREDPKYSLALVGLADCYLTSVLFGYSTPKVYPKAKDLASRALRAGGASAEAHASLGEFLMHYSYDWPGAARELERALQINPNCMIAHAWRSSCHAALGQLEDALVEAERAEELDPFAVVAMNEVSKNLYYARRYGEAIEKFTRSLKVEPESAYLHKGLAETYVQESMFSEAIREIEHALTISGRGALYLDSAAAVYALAGEERRSRQVLGEAEALASSRPTPSFGRAAARSVLGDNSGALQLLEAAYEQHTWMIWLGVDPVFDLLRSESRFRNLLRKMNLISRDPSQSVADAHLNGEQTNGEFEFELERSKIVFDQLSSDFLVDYMNRNFLEEKSGWRSIAEIARETGLPISSLYSKAPGSSPTFRELGKRGLIEIRLSPGERGRGGEVTKIRIAYSKSPVRNHIERLARVAKKKKAERSH